MTPLVSVVVPCFNAAPFLAETLQSVVGQTRPVDEILVVDDGSGDGSAAVARTFGSRVRIIEQANQGVSAARNTGVHEAAGDLIAFLDADDIWHPEKVERQVAYLVRTPDVGAVVSSVAKFEKDVSEHAPFLTVDDEMVRRAEPADFLVRTWVNQSAVMVRGSLARATPYPVHTGDSEDMIQAVELRLAAPIGAVPETLAYYRHHPRQATQRPDHMSKSLDTRLSWAARHHERLGYRSATAAMAPILEHATEQTMLHYWQRRVKQFRREREQLLRLWPSGVPVPQELRRTVLPRALLLLRDRLLD